MESGIGITQMRTINAMHFGLGNTAIVCQRRFDHGVVSVIGHRYKMKKCVKVEVPCKEWIELAHCFTV